jgi:trehalose 6-phosphate phosphatase
MTGPAGPGWAVFLDFDGTLVEIAPRPEAVRVAPDLPDLLTRLRDGCGGALAIVTGRAIPVIDGFLPGLDLDVCGLHGMERRRAGRTARVEVENLDAFRAAVPAVSARLAGLSDIVIEDKGESLALHWRLNPAAEPAIRAAGAELMARVGPAFRLQEGKAVIEIVPAVSGKGRAVEALMAEAPYRGRRPLFIGDDVTDEHGFAAVNALGGVAIKVGAGATAAGRRIADPAALRAWLARFALGQTDPDSLEAASGAELAPSKA